MDSKLALLLLALVALSACLAGAELVSEDADTDTDGRDETDDGLDGDGLRDEWGTLDILNGELPRYVEDRAAECAASKTEQACIECCGHKRSHSFKLDLKRIRSRFHRCTCHELNGQAESEADEPLYQH